VVAVRNEAASFADAVVSLLLDTAEWEKCCREQIEYAQARFSRTAMAASLLGAMKVAP
jgi:hypothetical protein